jgi:hypothetical protein
MRITVDIREDAFRIPKTARQIGEEIRQGATMLWLARGEVTLEDATRIATSVSQTEGADQGPMASELLLLGPDVGEDADFERPRHPGRELPKRDT